MSLELAEFAAFFREMHGRDPFPWQRELMRRVSQGGWPAELRLPTASGKTSAIDIAVFHLALQGRRPAVERSAALRTFFVIDRRVVVDQAAERAMHIANRIREGDGTVTRKVAERLREFGGEAPLRVAVLRGGTYRDETWVDRPNQPLICVSTVDQVGSRLLFRGYGISDGQRPVHAALTGCDSLILLDEAHLSAAFLETLGAVRGYQASQPAELPRMRFVSMSATSDEGAADVFQLSAEDRADSVLGPRLSAAKIATLREGKKFEDEAAAAAAELRKSASVIGIVVNRVASARQVFDKLGGEKILLTGRSRPWERDRLMEEYGARLGKADDAREPLYVVATQTIEVGADFDFDALVTEAASLDALRQRFGRLNRSGRFREARAAIIRRPPGRDKSDPIYGEALERTWQWLKERAAEGGSVDFGSEAMEALLRAHPAEGLTMRRDPAPLLFPAHLEAWSQTNPAPAADPDVSPFLHGMEARESADVQVVWRADLNEENREHWAAIVALAPPVVSEAMPVPVYAARAWLSETGAPAVADVEGAADVENADGGARPFLLWRGPEKAEVRDRPDGMYPGATIVVPSAYGGADQWGWNPGSKAPVADTGDLCSNALAALGARRFRVRLHAAVRPELAETVAELLKLLSPEDRDEELVDEKLDATLSAVDGWESRWGRRSPVLYPDKKGLLVISRARARKTPHVMETGEELTGEDDTGSFTRRGTLEQHTEGVRALCGDFAASSGLNNALIAALDAAALRHDLGKADERFQAMLWGRYRRRSEPLLAKSDFRTEAERRRSREASGYPRGGRHEFVSAAMVKEDPAVAATGEAALVSHLIGTHHGYGRGPAPVVEDPEPEEVSVSLNGSRWTGSSDHGLYRIGSGWVEQFDELQQRFGYWGLAYLETFLRRADCVRSRMEEES